MTDKITVRTTVRAPAERAWTAYTTPEDITKWNFASDDWQCPSAKIDLREGGSFSSRMEAKDGSVGFDFAGRYTKVVQHKQIEYELGGRQVAVAFTPEGDATLIIVSFDPDDTVSVEQQRSGWQAILNNFTKHVEDQGA